MKRIFAIKLKPFHIIILLLATLAVAACSSGNARNAMPPAPVTVSAAVEKTIPVQINAIGSVEAFQTISIKTKITGQITRVHFKEGQDVKKGDLLLELDKRPYIAALRQAEANLARDEAQAKNAEKNAERYAVLVQKGYVAREQQEQIHTNWLALDATVKADKAAVDNARVQVQYCSISAPISGRLGALKVHEGNEVKSSETEVAVINQLQPINVVFSIPEKELPDLKKHMGRGAAPRLAVDAFIPGDNIPEKGNLVFMDNAVNPATGTITLKGAFANAGRRLWPGQFVNVVLTLTTQPHAVLVPSQAVETGQEGKYVFVVKPDFTVELKAVETGRTVRGETVIVKGIAAGEQVVTDGQMRLTQGTKVAVKESPGPAGNTK